MDTEVSELTIEDLLDFSGYPTPTLGALLLQPTTLTELQACGYGIIYPVICEWERLRVGATVEQKKQIDRKLEVLWRLHDQATNGFVLAIDRSDDYFNEGEPVRFDHNGQVRIGCVYSVAPPLLELCLAPDGEFVKCEIRSWKLLSEFDALEDIGRCPKSVSCLWNEEASKLH